MDGKVEEAAARFHQGNYCVHQQTDATGLIRIHLSAWSSAQTLANGGLWKHFDFKPNPLANSPLNALYQAFNVDSADPGAALFNKPRGHAALAAQASVAGDR